METRGNFFGICFLEYSPANEEFRFQAFFGDESDNVRQSVIDRFDAIAAECAASDGITKLFCHELDEDNDECLGELSFAFSLPELNEIHYCPRFFESSPNVDCEDDFDQVTTTIHEMTHQQNVYAPSTDHHGFNVKDILKLNNEEKLSNSDSYSLFARGTFA